MSLLALKAALRLAEEVGAHSVLADVRQLGLPVYNPDFALEDYPPTLSWLLNEVRTADAYILCSPNYHGAISGAVKNVLDALNFLGRNSPPFFGGKVVGLLALGGNSTNVLNDLHHTARALNGLSAPIVVAVPQAALDTQTGDILDTAVNNRLRSMVEQIIDLTLRLRS